MKTTNETKSLAQLKKYHYLPVVESFLGDLETPLSIFKKIERDFLLESVEKVATLGRYSFIGKELREIVKVDSNSFELQDFRKGSETTELGWGISKSTYQNSSRVGKVRLKLKKLRVKKDGQRANKPAKKLSTSSYSKNEKSAETPKSVYEKKFDKVGRYTPLWEEDNYNTRTKKSVRRPKDAHHPLRMLADYYAHHSMPPLSKDLPPFLGGLVGTLGFDAVGFFEKLPNTKKVIDIPIGTMVFPRFVIAYDNLTRAVSLVYLVASPYFSNSIELGQVNMLDEAKKIIRNAMGNYPKGNSEALLKRNQPKSKDKTNKTSQSNSLPARQAYEDAKKKLEDEAKIRLIEAKKNLALLRDTLLANSTSRPKSAKIKTTAKLSPSAKQSLAVAKRHSHQLLRAFKEKKPNHSQKTYQKMVAKCVDHIKKGDAFQIVPSLRFSFPLSVDPFEVYRNLRQVNPSPYMFYLKLGDFSLVGSSPEVMVKVAGEEVMLRPIAGTRKRGKDASEDKQLEAEMLADEKELAEHLMLIDLARNDLGRISELGSVKVKEHMSVEKYSHVQHIVSLVTGKKKKMISPVDLIAAAFPAGTLSGAPKVKACEIIARQEKDSRATYGGMVFYWSFDGNFDSCITIRTLLVHKQMAHFQVGAGVVSDSEPRKEYQECMHNAGGIFTAIYQAGLRLQDEMERL